MAGARGVAGAGDLAAVLAAYDLQPAAAVLVSAKPRKPVWRIAVTGGDQFLKRLPYRRPRVSFALGAAEHLHGNGVAVPRLFHAANGAPFAEVRGACYVLLESVEGSPPLYATHLDAIAAAMARFHEGSRGYRVPAGGYEQDHRPGWIPGYVRATARLRAAAAVAEGLAPLGQPLAGHASVALARARLALERLEAVYPAAAAEAAGDPILCHQDFASSNLRVDDVGRIVVFDLEGVARDLAPRDIRKLLTKVAKVEGRWSRQLVDRTLGAYTGVRPLTAAERGLLLAELTFPHLLAGLAKKLFLRREPEWPPEDCLRRLAAAIELERSQEAVVDDLAAEWGGAA